MLSTFIKLPFVFKTFVLSILSGRLRQVLLYVKLIKFVKKVIMNKWATTVRSVRPSLNISD